MNQLTDLPPQNLELEKTILHCIIQRHERRAFFLANLEPEHFYDLRHQALFTVARQIHDREAALDQDILATDLLKDGSQGQRLLQCGGVDYVYEILGRDHFGSPHNGRIYIRDLRELAKMRRDRQIGERLAGGQVLEEERQALLEELGRPAWDGALEEEGNAAAVASVVVSEYEAAAALARSGRQFAGLDAGFERLNLHLNGLCPGELTVLAGRPSIGKSTPALQIALSVAQTAPAPVGIISLEMTRGQLGARLCGLLSGVSPHRQRRGLLDAEERERFSQAVSAFSRLPIHVYVQDRSLAAIRARITQRPDVALWVVDHLHRVVGGPGDNDHERLGNIAHALADLAVQLDRPVLLLSQLNRACEERPDKIPQLSDLRGSGSIEEHAVNVLLLYRPGHYKELLERVHGDAEATEELLHAATVYAEKCRFEAPGPIELRWVPERACFGDPLPEYRRPDLANVRNQRRN